MANKMKNPFKDKMFIPIVVGVVIFIVVVTIGYFKWKAKYG